MLSVLCLTGAGRVRCAGVPSSEVLLWVARPETVTAVTTATAASGWVGLVVNGFSAPLLTKGGGSLRKMQELIDVLSRTDPALVAACGQDEELAKLHDLVQRQMAHRLPDDFHVSAAEGEGKEPDPEEDVDTDDTSSSSSSVVSESPFDGWQSYEVLATVQRCRYLVTVYCPTARRP
eukprot:gene18723-13487_t